MKVSQVIVANATAVSDDSADEEGICPPSPTLVIVFDNPDSAREFQPPFSTGTKEAPCLQLSRHTVMYDPALPDLSIALSVLKSPWYEGDINEIFIIWSDKVDYWVQPLLLELESNGKPPTTAPEHPGRQTDVRNLGFGLLGSRVTQHEFKGGRPSRTVGQNNRCRLLSP